MNRSTHFPPEALQGFVKRIELYESGKGEYKPLQFFADGHPGLIYQETQDGLYLNEDQKRLSTLFLYGQTLAPVRLVPRGDYRMMILHLQPNAIRTLYGINPAELTDTCLDLKLLPKPSFKELPSRLEDLQHSSPQLELLLEHLSKLSFQPARSNDPLLQHAIRSIRIAKGQVPLRLIRDQLGISQRTFERRFEQQVGIRPGLFKRVCQFQASLKQLHEKRFDKLSDIAYDNGYSDQSHFIRNFQEFTSMPPLQYYKELIKAPPPTLS